MTEKNKEVHSQAISGAQYVYTYGPGALIEAKTGARLIPTLNHSFKFNFTRTSPDWIREKKEIKEPRLTTIIKERFYKNEEDATIHLFELPTNADVNIPDSKAINITYYFPTWAICFGNSKNNEHEPILFNTQYTEGNGCPICKSLNISQIRFVLACPKGHLGEINWDYVVHHEKKTKRCKPKFYLWKIEGTTLEDIKVQCPKCRKSISIKDLYKNKIPLKCNGVFPEKERHGDEHNHFRDVYYVSFKKGKCEEKPKITLRQSSLLRTPIILNSVTIPFYDKTIIDELQKPKIIGNIETILLDDYTINDEVQLWDKLKEKFLKIFRKNKLITTFINNNGIIKLIELFLKINPTIAVEIGEENNSIIGNKFKNITNNQDLLLSYDIEELKALSKEERIKSEKENFIKLKAVPVDFPIDSLQNEFLKIKVHAIEKLRVISAQVGYVRNVYPENKSNLKLVLNGITLNSFRREEIWIPAHAGSGEGIFLFFDRESIGKILNIQTKIRSYLKNWEKKQDINLININEEYIFEPIFVWLHTLSHSLMRAISLYGGYSLASLREKIYYNKYEKEGGILIFTYSQTSDISMGGLISLANKETMKYLFKIAINNIDVCSNDPLCINQKKTPEKTTGAACYSCLFISETSCPYMNKGLDRHIFLLDL